MKKTIQLKQTDFGEEYISVLWSILEIRKARRSLYGDTFKEMPSLGHYYHAFNKMHRLQMQLTNELKSGKVNTKNYEKIEDNAIDIINYLIFFLITRRME